MKNKIIQFTIVHLCYIHLGFIFEFITIDFANWKNSERSLFSLSIGKGYFYINIFFLEICLYDKTDDPLDFEKWKQ